MPRSESRDRSDRYEGNRGYFRRPDGYRRERYALALVALALAGWWVAADVAMPTRMQYAHTHGPLANPHAAWDRDCEACHRPHSLPEFGPRAVFDTRARWRDLNCEQCHRGPAHTANVADAGREFHRQCANCHHDHGGRNNSLVELSDDHCTRCHADLGSHHAGNSKTGTGQVTDFVNSHPEFRALASPPARTLKFSHALHMTPGQTHSPGGREAMTVERLRALAGEAAAERYRATGQGDEGPVLLDCSSCHKLDSGAGTTEYSQLKALLAASGEPSRSLLPPRGDGAHFQPVNFDTHCRSCHPLRAPDGASAGLVIPGFDVPHRRQPGVLAGELRAGYLRGLIAKEHPALAKPLEPGGRLDGAPAGPAATIRAETDRLATAAVGFFVGPGCAKCHDTAGETVAPVADRSVWFPAARFSHAAHKATACATCHPGTGAASAPLGTALVEKEPVQILGVDSCRACHSPAGTKVTFPDGSTTSGGGVRHSCTDCHRYHNLDHGLQGRGAAAFFPERPLKLTAFLRK